ncbi:hypothetical protein [Variovorax ginsengisoli]|uniref:Uncharacterized protein n=1 Tax=Variovorax ginsengisoli TaxID=363844 RepID=A0ABT8S246_9BURK|nr:hypothetical protein [Variovorax ginsengisoli]MDN8613408.1 hypothetical protein [Variovorax ginsengisoli]MDO1532578.1 hypothetical protein [Variovorax ginsengisoli]
MIFETKRRQASEAGVESEALAQAPSAVAVPVPAPDVRVDRMDRGGYPQDVPVAVRAAADSQTDSRRTDVEPLEPLFPADVAENFRRGWDAVQIGFVDDPRRAVQKADELVQQVLHDLAESFSGERSRIEAHAEQADSTEELRVALRRDRAFLERLLSL